MDYILIVIGKWYDIFLINYYPRVITRHRDKLKTLLTKEIISKEYGQQTIPHNFIMFCSSKDFSSCR